MVKLYGLRLVFLGLVFGLFMPGALLAQEDDAEETVEEVIAIGKSIKTSQMAAIEAKRSANNVADIISADAIGRFPDQNLAAALGRIPGVSIERDQGQARYINFRGSPKRYTTIAFDGIDVPGVENGRVPRFDAYPAVITSQVVANKAVTADMPGESISGYINVKTFRPSDIDGWATSLEIGRGEQDLGGGDIERTNARVSYSDDKFGILFYGSENKRAQMTDNRELTLSGPQNALVPEIIQFRSYFVDRSDEGYGGTVEFNLDNGGRIYFNTLSTEFTDSEDLTEYRFYMVAGAAITGSTVTPVEGTLPIVRSRRGWRHGAYVNETDVNTIGADLVVGEWDVTTSYSQVDTFFNTWLPIPYFMYGLISDVSYDITNPEKPIVTFPSKLNDVNYLVRYYLEAFGTMDTETDQWKVDLSRMNDLGEVKFGFKYDDREATGGGAPIAVRFGGMPIECCEQFNTEKPFITGMNNTVGATYSDNKGVIGALEAAGYFQPPYSDDEKVSIEETILSAYVMQTIDKDWGNIVVGVRFEDTDYDTTGVKLVGTEYFPLTVNQSYTNVLPSAHFNWDFADDRKLRFSFSTGISRPTYIEARAAATINVLGETVEGGNPFLEEEKSWGFDAAYEWYFDEASLFSFTLFSRDIDNIIFESSEKVLGSIYFDGAPAGQLWDLTSYGNGDNGKIQGVEIAFTGRLDNYIDGFWSGFGFTGNITSIDSEFTTPGGVDIPGLPGQSDFAYNASIFYEDYGFSIRLSYSYRDSFFDETEQGLEYENISWAEQQRLDASIRYDLEGLTGYQASLFMDMNNITDEVDVRFTGKEWNPNQVEQFGRRFVAGFRINF